MTTPHESEPVFEQELVTARNFNILGGYSIKRIGFSEHRIGESSFDPVTNNEASILLGDNSIRCNEIILDMGMNFDLKSDISTINEYMQRTYNNDNWRSKRQLKKFNKAQESVSIEVLPTCWMNSHFRLIEMLNHQEGRPTVDQMNFIFKPLAYEHRDFPLYVDSSAEATEVSMIFPDLPSPTAAALRLNNSLSTFFSQVTAIRRTI